MISVPNLQQPLNGNKWFFILVAFLFLTSCELFKPVQTGAQQPAPGRTQPKPIDRELDPIQGRKVFDPETGTYVIIANAPVEKMDTIRWTSMPVIRDQIITSSAEALTENPPIKSNEPVEIGKEVIEDDNENAIITSKKLNVYNVAIVLPFLSDRFSTNGGGLPQNSEWALGFYGGVRLALEDLERENIKLQISVVDDRASETYTPQLLNNRDIQNAQLIIGPYRREIARQLADYAKATDKILLSPYTTSDSVTARNPNYVQVNPSLQTHCQAITRHARQRYRPEQIVLLCRTREEDRLEYFQQENALISKGINVKRFTKYVVPDNVELNSGQLSSLMRSDTTVFIVPSFSSESFIASFLRKLDLAKRENQTIVVYGMPQWMDYETIDFEYFERLNVHISTSSFFNPLSPDVQFFKRRFFDRYGSIAKEEAFLGYDVTFFGAKMLQKYGTKFQYFMEKEPTQMLHTRFEFERVINLPTNSYNTENLPIQRFENKYVNILHFEDYQFKLSQ